MRYALIGCGRISPNHIEAAKNNHLEIAAVCDLAEEKMRGKFDLPDSVHFYTDYKTLLTNEKPELVAIATESGKHAEIALDCIAAGCHVIIEKPIALSIADADHIIASAKEKGVLVCVSHQNRFNKSVQYIRKALEEGRFGKLMHGAVRVYWNRAEEYYMQAPWRGTWAQDGGALMNQCIHSIYLLCWMLGGDVAEVFAYTDNLKHPFIEAEDLGLALVKCRNGAYGVIEGTTNVYPKNLEETLYLFGERGTVKAGGKSVNIIEEWNFADGADDPAHVKAVYGENPPNIYGYGHTPLYADMLDAIKNNRAPYVSGEDGRRALELVLAVYQSAQKGLPVKLPLESGSTLDFRGRFEK